MKTLFVTVGTTRFDDLIRGIFDPQFVEAACSHGYTCWIVQYGLSDVRFLQASPFAEKISVDLFPFRSDLAPCYAQADLIVSHAGSGSILDALRGPLFADVLHRIPLLVIVANLGLKNNHQMELVHKMGEMGVAFPVPIHAIANMFNIIDGQDRSVLAKVDLKTSEAMLMGLL